MNKPTSVMACDPGKKGSFCLLVPSTKLVDFYPTDAKPMDILTWIVQMAGATDIQMIMIEDVHSIYGTSAKSNFMFGYNVGVVNALAQATGLSVDKVTPKVWQRTIGVKQGSKGPIRKQDIAQICDRLYPKVNIRGPKGGLLDGLSDSLMIAHFTQLKYGIK